MTQHIFFAILYITYSITIQHNVNYLTISFEKIFTTFLQGVSLISENSYFITLVIYMVMAFMNLKIFTRSIHNFYQKLKFAEQHLKENKAEFKIVWSLGQCLYLSCHVNKTILELKWMGVNNRMGWICQIIAKRSVAEKF